MTVTLTDLLSPLYRNTKVRDRTGSQVRLSPYLIRGWLAAWGAPWAWSSHTWLRVDTKLCQSSYFHQRPKSKA
jgi:hypothetical protein